MSEKLKQSVAKNKENMRQLHDVGLLSEATYDGDQSQEFDEHLRSRQNTEARQDNLSKVTDTNILFSSWHVPCHDVILRDPDGKCQILHVQPNKASASLLTFEQKEAMKAFGQRHGSSIVSKGERSWFGFADEQELESVGIHNQKTIAVDTNQWWRLLYDPQTNEVWIDIKDKKLLRKYKGFSDANESSSS